MEKPPPAEGTGSVKKTHKGEAVSQAKEAEEAKVTEQTIKVQEERKEEREDGEEEEEEGEGYEEDEDEDEEGETGKVKYRKKVEVKLEEDSEFDVEEDDESLEISLISCTSRALSAIPFTWGNETYIFEELSDPGTLDNIFKPVPVQKGAFDDTGATLYVAVCKSLNFVPTSRILKALKTEEIDLSYRNVHTNSIRSLCAALEVNNIITRLKLRYNKFSPTDCFYFGYVLLCNEKISFMDLTGCRIGPEGLRLLIKFLGLNVALENLILSKCNIQDEGMSILSFVLMKNVGIKNLDLSYNNLGENSGEPLSRALKANCSLRNLNLRYNSLFHPVAMKPFYLSLASNQRLESLNLSWNGLRGVEMALNIAKFLRSNQSVKHLDLSNNSLGSVAMMEIRRALPRSKLETLKIGNNTITADDIDYLLKAVKANPTLKVLDLEGLWINKSFLKMLSKITQERQLQVTYEGVYSNYKVFGPDYRAVILKRAQFEAQKPKKAKMKKDFGHLMWNLGDKPLTEEAFMNLVKSFKAKVNKELYPELLKQFTLPKSDLIDVVAMRKKYLSLFPDSQPPPPKETKKKGEVGKGKKKKRAAEEEKTEQDVANEGEFGTTGEYEDYPGEERFGELGEEF